MTIKKTAGSEDLLQFITASGTKHLSIDYTGQLTYNVGATGPIYFGNFNNATDGRAGFSTPMNVIMGIDAATHRFGIGGGGTYFVGNAPKALLEVRGKADELQLAIQANSSQTANLTEWRNSSGTAISVVNSIGNFGIGMNNPSYALSVKHTNFGTGFTVHLGMETNDCIMLQNSNVESTISSTNERFHLANNTANIITMYNSNVGVGTVSPTTKLDVVGGLKVSGTSTDKNISLTGGFGSGIGGEINLMSGYGTNARGGNINIAAGYTSSWAGIGTSSDIFIKGGCMETITSYASVQVGGGKSEVGGTNETAGGDLTLSGGNANLGNQNGGNIILLPGTASGSGVNGNVGIGTTTPARTLHINAVMRLEPIPTAPSSPSKGDIYFDSTINKLRVYDGTIWQDCW